MTHRGPCLLDCPDRPLVDPDVLARLRTGLDDDEGWLLFLKRFLIQLPLRIDKLRSGLAGGDAALATDAVLSLKISSQMVGAERLAGMALHLQRSVEDAVQQGDAATALPKLAALHMADISACADQTMVPLAAKAADPERSLPAGAG